MTCKYAVNILVAFFEMWLMISAPVTSEFPGRQEIAQVTMVTKRACGFRNQYLPQV
jgi:hypothetical protein